MLSGMRGQLGLGLTGLFLQLSLAGFGDLQGRGKRIKVAAFHKVVDIHDHARQAVQVFPLLCGPNLRGQSRRIDGGIQQRPKRALVS